MKAVVYKGINHVEVENVKDPAIEKAEDIVLKVTATAICGSDLHLIHGMVPGVKHGSILGHEAMGVVEETGREVTHVKKGDRVIVPFPVACGRCWYCSHDLYSQCDQSNDYGEVGGLYGYGRMLGGYDGGQAEYLRVPYANTGPVKVPDLPDEKLLFLTDILPTSYWGAEQAEIMPGDTVAVLGCGPVGLLAQRWAKWMGAERVIAVDCVGYRLEWAKKFNGAEVLNFKDYDNAGEYVKEITGGGADAVIDCVGMDGKMSFIEKAETALKLQGGSKSAIEIASQAVRKGGTVSIVGVYGTRYNRFPLGDFFSRNITLKMGQCPANAYIDHILKLIEEGEFDPSFIVTHRLPLTQASQAYTLFDKKEDGCIKVILKPQ